MAGRNLVRRTGAWLGLGVAVGALGVLAAPAALEVGLAVRDVSPELPIRLAGYAGRQQAADRAEHPLLVQALALRNPTGERFVFVALDNCEVSGGFMAPVLQQCLERYQLPRGAVAVVSSHTHSAPVLESTLTDMTQPTTPEREQIVRYSRRLQHELVAVVGAALETFEPATLEHGVGRATFGMNRRVYRGIRWCSATTRTGRWTGTCRCCASDDPTARYGRLCLATPVTARVCAGETTGMWSQGEYMAYARQHLEAMHPGRWRCT
ncbi:MAG: hypothetical protein M5U12_09930 [Verrucomicrobia bacterium]|nr:hypothetical protein [Verrucomicrobiota bacterium]